jgi:hypothetical protein
MTITFVNEKMRWLRCEGVTQRRRAAWGAKPPPLRAAFHRLRKREIGGRIGTSYTDMRLRVFPIASAILLSGPSGCAIVEEGRHFLSRAAMIGAWGARARRKGGVMAKGQQRSNKEARKPKKAKVKTNASQPSQKGGVRGLENMKNS